MRSAKPSVVSLTRSSSVTKISREVVIAGIPNARVEMARRIVDHIEAIEGIRPDFGTVDVSMHRDDISTRGRPTAVVPPICRSRSTDGRSFWSMTFSLPAGAVAQPWMRFPPSVGPPAFNMRSSWIAGIANCRFAPTTWERIFPRRGRSESGFASKTWMERPIA